jgi:hypothetical protein
MRATYKFIYLLLLLLTNSCSGTTKLKQLHWRNYIFRLDVSSGGATTDFSWRVVAIHTGWLGSEEDEIFQAYGGPYLKDIQLDGNILVLLASRGGSSERIELDLQHLDEFVKQPILYHRYALRNQNIFYLEPVFIEELRKQEQAYESQAEQRRQQYNVRKF